MTLAVGWHMLPGGEDDGTPLGASTFLDLAADRGLLSPERLVRPYFKGRAAAVPLAEQANDWAARGCRVQLGNEPNLAEEGFGGGPADYAAWFLEAANHVWPGTRLYYAGMSPSGDWRSWYTHPLARRAIARSSGLCVHAYGSFAQMREIVAWLAETFPDKPLWLGEVNFGAGQRVDRDAWADGALRPFLDWAATVPAVEAATYFSYRWRDPDMSLPTPVDGAGTGIERVLRAWTAPKEPTVAEIDLSTIIPVEEMLSRTHHGAARTRTDLVVIHATRSGITEVGHTPQREAEVTAIWMGRDDIPASQRVSSQYVIGPEKVFKVVEDGVISWHAAYLNERAVGLEVAQATATTSFMPSQVDFTARLTAAYCVRYGIPVRRLTDENQRGIIGHQDAAQGKQSGKSDPGALWDWDRFIALVGQYAGGTPVADTADQLRDQTFALASQLQALDPKWKAAGWPSLAAGIGSNAEAIKSLVRASKGER